MLRRWLLALLVLCLTPLALSLPSEAGGSGAAAGRYVVVLKDTAPVSAVAGTATGLGATVDSLFGALNTVVLSLSPRAADRLRRDPRVAFVTPDRPVRLLAGTAAAPTGVSRIGAAPVASSGGSAPAEKPRRRAAVAILDTGIAERPDLNVAGGTADCAPKGILGSGKATPSDSNGHGTHVAGTVAADGSAGVLGVSPGTPLYAVRIFNASGEGNLSNVICGLNWVAENAADKHIKVVNMSLGGEGSDGGDCGVSDHDAFHAAVCNVTAAGVTVVAAAGNDAGDLAGSTPAAYDEVLAVTAMADFDGKPGGLARAATCDAQGQDDTAASFSAYAVPGSPDAEHTIAAPGVCITSTWKDGGTKTISGTSMASPHVAGLVARCLDAGPCKGDKPAEIIAKLRADALSRPASTGFLGDPAHPIADRYYGPLAQDVGY